MTSDDTIALTPYGTVRLRFNEETGYGATLDGPPAAVEMVTRVIEETPSLQGMAMTVETVTEGDFAGPCSARLGVLPRLEFLLAPEPEEPLSNILDSAASPGPIARLAALRERREWFARLDSAAAAAPSPREADLATLASIADRTHPDMLEPELGDIIEGILARWPDDAEVAAAADRATEAYGNPLPPR